MGAVLYQKQDGKDRVVAYASRSLKPAEKNYPAHKLELLALKWTVTEKFHDYLYGTEFTVETDNNPLTYVLTTAKLDATGQRWVAALANYKFIIKYGRGKTTSTRMRCHVCQRRLSTLQCSVHSVNRIRPYRGASLC